MHAAGRGAAILIALAWAAPEAGAAARAAAGSPAIPFEQAIRPGLGAAPREASSGRYHLIVGPAEDVDPETAGRLAAALGAFEEAYRAMWSETLPLREPAPVVTVLFCTRTGTLRRAMEQAGISVPSFETGGIYLPEFRILAVENASKLERSRIASLVHEAAHLLNREMLDGARMTPWFNEGLAQYCEYSRYETGSPVGVFHLGEIEEASEVSLPDGEGEILYRFDPARSLSYLQGQFMRDRALSLGPMLEIRNAGAFYGQGAQLRYAQSWTLIHLLAHGATRGHGPLRPSLPRYARMEQEGKGGRSALLENLGMSLEDLDDAWYRHLRKLW